MQPATELPYPFLDTLERLFGVLRRNGFEFGNTAALNAVEALSVTGLSDRRHVRSALEASLVRSSQDVATFRRLFDMFFTTVSQQMDESQTDALDRDVSDTLRQQVPEPYRDLADALAQGDWDAIQHAMQQAADAVGLDRIESFMQEGYYTYRMLDRLGGFAIEAAVSSGLSGGHSGQRALEAAQERVENLFDAVRQQVRRQLRMNDLLFRERFREESLLNRNFFRASNTEKEQMKQMLRKMAERLRTRVALRRRAAKGRQLHLSRTIRHSLATEGVPFRISHKRKTIRKPELVMLCDMSESVRAATEFMLLFVFSLQELFTKVHSFVFVADTADVTDVFRYNDFESAVTEISTGQHLNLWANSDFGRAFRQFEVEHMHVLTPRTTLIVLGDARGNYNDPQIHSFETITRRVARTIWLNPEPRTSWGFGDSLMQEYGPFCDDKRDVRTLAQLDTFVRSLIRI